MARSSTRRLSALLVLDVLLLAGWGLSTAFVPAPPRVNVNNAAVSAAVAAAMTQLPEAAEAVDKWVYKEPSGKVEPEQITVFTIFFLVHAAGIADFYAKKVGAGPAVPFNPFRTQQFWDPEKTDKGLWTYEDGYKIFGGKRDKRGPGAGGGLL